MWIVTESPEFATRALGIELAGDLRDFPLAREALTPSLRFLVDELVPGRRIYGRKQRPDNRWVGGDVLALQAPIASQFDAAIELVRAGYERPLYCIAGAGASFRGHHGRSWSASLGNLHLTAILRPEKTGSHAVSALVALPSVALCDVLIRQGGLSQSRIKWVNDVLLDGSKVGGVLAHTSWRGDQVAAIVYGLGLNVEITPTIALDPAVPSATSVCAYIPQAQLHHFAMPLMRALDQRLRNWSDHGGMPLLDAYRDLSVVLGKEVEILRDPRPLHEGEASLSRQIVRKGKVLAIDDDLGVTLDDGNLSPVREGRIRLVEPVSHQLDD